MADRINYIKQLNAFWEDQGSSGYIKPTSQAVYFSLLQINNICGWKDPFLATYTQVLNMTGISNAKTYYSALEELSSQGYLTWFKSSNQHQAPSFSLRVLYQNSEEQSKSTVTALTLHTEEQSKSTVIIPKQLNKKQENNNDAPLDLFFSLDGNIESVIAYTEPSLSKSKKDINILFDDFWKLYPNKTGSKKAAEEKWKRLKNKDREDIMVALPAFINYRLFPTWNHPQATTYLNQHRWKDNLNSSDPGAPTNPQTRRKVIDHSKL